MNNIRKAIFVSLAAAGIGAIALPVTAAALTASTLATEVDDVKINTVGFDLAGPGLAASAALTPARVVWKQTATGAAITFDGSIYFDGVANNCARVELISYDENSVEILPRVYSTEECVSTNAYVERFVSVDANPGASEVKVRLQTALNVVNPVWGSVGAKTATYGPSLGTTEVSISAPEVDLGTGTFASGTAPDPATVTWTVSGANEITPTTDGTLYMKRADDRCARMRYTYLKQGLFGLADTVLETRYGTEHCVTDDQLHEFAVHAGAYANVAVNKVEIAIETSPSGSGNWTVQGSVTATLPVALVPVWP